ncbi:MAG: septum formation initiator family protein [Candidatus Cloacimonetes bacterium]|nr:septum formation initiator family protein [Candidatus Cloacimonadota bacterium]
MKKKLNPLEQKKPVRIIFWLILVFFVTLVLIWDRTSILKVLLNYRDVTKLEKKIEVLQKENQKLQEEINEIKTNPEVSEKIAREKLGYQKSDEKVYRFITPEEEQKQKKKD